MPNIARSMGTHLSWNAMQKKALFRRALSVCGVPHIKPLVIGCRSAIGLPATGRVCS